MGRGGGTLSDEAMKGVSEKKMVKICPAPVYATIYIQHVH